MIYFVFPVFNEEKSLYDFVTGLRKLMCGQEYQMIAVDDGSTDKSLDILKALKGDDLIVDTSIINMNVGAVFSVGINLVLSNANDDDIMIVLESDQTSDIELVKRLVDEIQGTGNDIAIASRYKDDGKYLNFSFVRKMLSFYANFLMRLCFPIKDVYDYTIFFRAYRIEFYY